MDKKFAPQFNLTLHPANQNQSIPETNQHEALQKFAELIADFLKTHRPLRDNEKVLHHGK